MKGIVGRKTSVLPALMLHVPGCDGESVGMGVRGDTAVENVTRTSLVPATSEVPLAGVIPVTRSAGGGDVEPVGTETDVEVDVGGGVAEPWPFVTMTATATPAPARTIAVTTSTRSGVNVTVQRRGL
jgi:hypothetical protein